MSLALSAGQPDYRPRLRRRRLWSRAGAVVLGIVLLIWWGYATGHIKHVDSVPLPPTAPATAPTPR